MTILLLSLRHAPGERRMRRRGADVYPNVRTLGMVFWDATGYPCCQSDGEGYSCRFQRLFHGVKREGLTLTVDKQVSPPFSVSRQGVPLPVPPNISDVVPGGTVTSASTCGKPDSRLGVDDDFAGAALDPPVGFALCGIRAVGLRGFGELGNLNVRVEYPCGHLARLRVQLFLPQPGVVYRGA